MVSNMVANLFSPKKARQKRQYNYNTIPIFRSIFLPSNYTVLHLFLINNIEDF